MSVLRRSADQSIAAVATMTVLPDNSATQVCVHACHCLIVLLTQIARMTSDVIRVCAYPRPVEAMMSAQAVERVSQGVVFHRSFVIAIRTAHYLNSVVWMAVASCPVDVKTIPNVVPSSPVWLVPVFLCHHLNVSVTMIAAIGSNANLAFAFRELDVQQIETAPIASGVTVVNVYLKRLNVFETRIVSSAKFARVASVKNSHPSVEVMESAVSAFSVATSNVYQGVEPAEAVQTARFARTVSADRTWNVPWTVTVLYQGRSAIERSMYVLMAVEAMRNARWGQVASI